MRLIIAKYRGKCAETGKPIRKGDSIYFDDRNRRTYHITATTPHQPADPSVAAYIAAQESYAFDRHAEKISYFDRMDPRN